ncbi:amidophosphoribosyltransferase [Streptomyces sp. NPDC023998]|uniref:amidophosphoribosyltransferase n=1 Tax=Streptomyces sp. NPDC023998 TaxID=3154597 RepID=UPI0033C4F4A7
MPLDSVGEKCGVVAFHGTEGEAAPVLYHGLIALQHRGQEAAGVAVWDGTRIRSVIGPGLVQQALGPERIRELNGQTGIGHTRYSTAGGKGSDSVQPLLGTTALGYHFALAHNGNLVNVGKRLIDGPDMASDRSGNTDTQALVDALSDYHGTVQDALRAVLPMVGGAFSLTVLAEDGIYAARDPQGFRPLCLGQLEQGFMVASETAALDAVGAQFVREVGPGELMRIDYSGVTVEHFAEGRPARCLFEYVYFSRQDSQLGGQPVERVRRALGRALAEESPADADLVIPVPDTARPAALGFAAESLLPYDEGLARNHYMGRTFISPDDPMRRLGVRLKLSPLPDVLRGRRVVLVDDSVVRANTSRAVVSMLRSAGAAEVHLRVASAPVRWPCFFGIDMKTRAELAAANGSLTDLRKHIGADSLGFLSVGSMVRAAGGRDLCTGCFTGAYPVPIPSSASDRTDAGVHAPA